MLTLLFIICMFGVFGKLFCFGVKAAWGISKFVLTIVFLPLILLNGGRRTDLHSIAGTSCYWSCRTDRIESISREKAVNL